MAVELEKTWVEKEIEQSDENDGFADYVERASKGDLFTITKIAEFGTSKIYNVRHHFLDPRTEILVDVENSTFIKEGDNYPYNFVRFNGKTTTFLRYMELSPDGASLTTFACAIPEDLDPQTSVQDAIENGTLKGSNVWNCETGG